MGDDLPLLIAVSGKLGSGKDYIAENLLLPLISTTVSKMAFADHIKINVASQEPDVSLRQCLEGDKSTELRRKLQIAGTEQGRDLYGSDIWVTTLENWIRLRRLRDRTPDVVLVTDCRFPNEAKWIEDNGGLLIRVHAPSRNEFALKRESNGCNNTYTAIKQHLSETALDEYPFKYTVDNAPEFQLTVGHQISEIVKIYVDEHLDHSNCFHMPIKRPTKPETTSE
jgi:hypothetical protein